MSLRRFRKKIRKKASLLTSSAIVEAGTTIRVVINAKGAYKNSISVDYRVVDTLIKGSTFAIEDQIYNGKEIEITSAQQFKKAVYKGTELRFGTDFEVVPGSYSNNLEEGVAKVTVRGIGNYGGQKTDYDEKLIYLKEKYDIIINSLIQIYNNQHRNGE